MISNEKYVMELLEQRKDPVSQNILNLVRNNKTNEIEMIARNIMNERGLNFDNEFQKFKKLYSL